MSSMAVMTGGGGGVCTGTCGIPNWRARRGAAAVVSAAPRHQEEDERFRSTLAFGQRFADMGLTIQLGVLEVPDPQDVTAVRRDRVLQQAHLLGLVDPGLVLVTVAIGCVVEHGARDGAADQGGDAVDRDSLDAGPRHVLVEDVLDPLDRAVVGRLLAQFVQLAALEFVAAPVGIDDECRLAQGQDERRFAVAVRPFRAQRLGGSVSLSTRLKAMAKSL